MQELADMDEHGEQLGDSEGSMMNGQGSIVCDSKIKISKAHLKLVFDIPCLTLIDYTQFRTRISPRIMRPRYSKVRQEHIIV